MTSKRFFFKVMQEDLRHKVWMAALSALGSFLMITVVWLIWWSNQAGYRELAELRDTRFELDIKAFVIGETIVFFHDFVTVMGGLVAIAGGVIAGLFGFRYVYHKNMVDVYHSLPIKRDLLFGAGFLNGFLIWFVPFLISYLPTVILAGGFIRGLGGSGQDIRQLVGTAVLSVAVLATVFLLVYGLVLTAVMLSGNILNTLVAMMTLGFGVISLSGILYAFFAFYMDRFYGSWNWQGAIHASPLFAACNLLYRRMENDTGVGGILALDLGIAVLLCCCAWLLYRKRASELAEHGIRNRAAGLFMKIVAGIVAGMGGWLLFMLFTAKITVFWGIFGMVLAGGLCTGVLGIIFDMDFKAFFAHKRQMVAILAATLLLCTAFHQDWPGYDDYLPPKEKIAQIALGVAGEFSNRYIADKSEQSPLQNMQYEDADTIYAYLESAMGERTGITVPTKVTLRSGRSYYRYYWLDRGARELLWPLVTSESYLRAAFCIEGEMIQDCEEFDLRRGSGEETFRLKDYAKGTFEGIMEAYNRDVLEDPSGVFAEKGRRLVGMYFGIKAADGRSARVSISVYDTMEHTVAALEKAGFGEWVSEADPGEIVSVTLKIPGGSEEQTKEERIAAAREYYGVQGEAGTSEADPADVKDLQESAPTTEDVKYDTMTGLEITDRAEIDELCALMDYAEPCRSDRMFRDDSIEILCTDREGNQRRLYLPQGALPEKYILRFGDCS